MNDLFIITHASSSGQILRTHKGKAYRLASSLDEAQRLSRILVATSLGSECQVCTTDGGIVGQVFSRLA